MRELPNKGLWVCSNGQVSWPGLPRKQGRDEGLLGGVTRGQEGSRTARGGGAELRAGCGGPRAAGLRRRQASQNRASVREEKEAGTDLRGRGAGWSALQYFRAEHARQTPRKGRAGPGDGQSASWPRGGVVGGAGTHRAGHGRAGLPEGGSLHVYP